jgi:hypothetical protein
MVQFVKKQKVWRYILTPVFLLISSFICWVIYISYHYDFSIIEATKSSVRYVSLSAIGTGVGLYDPTADNTIHAQLGPEEMSNFSSMSRIEQYLAKGKVSGIEIIEMKNEHIVISDYVFNYQPDVPRLLEMRKEMGLDDVVAGADDELEKMIRLRQWVRKQFSRLDYQKTMAQFDALTIWGNPQRNPEKKKNWPGNYNPCHFFPLFYSQVMLSMGYIPRVVHISYTGYDYHGFTEVWSNQYRKWISMDPDLNLHYEYEGVPQNILEVHNFRYRNNTRLKVMQVMVEPGIQPLETTENMLDYHQYVEIADLRNDWLTNKYFRGHPKRSDLATLAWKDDREPEIFRLTPATRNIEDMYWTLNQAEILVESEKCGQDSLALLFNTVTPNFSHFAIHMNGKAFEQTSPVFVWKLQSGRNELIVYPVNSFGVHGISSRIVLQYESE